jgi:hypothetical protein
MKTLSAHNKQIVREFLEQNSIVAKFATDGTSIVWRVTNIREIHDSITGKLTRITIDIESSNNSNNWSININGPKAVTVFSNNLFESTCFLNRRFPTLDDCLTDKEPETDCYGNKVTKTNLYILFGAFGLGVMMPWQVGIVIAGISLIILVKQEGLK